MATTKDVFDALERLATVKGMIYLFIATQVLGVGPMAIVVSVPALFIELPVTKLLLLSIGLTLPALIACATVPMFFLKLPPTDRDVRKSLAMSAAYMIQAQGGAVLLTWLVSHKGFGLYVTATVVSIATVAFLEWRDRAAPAQIDDASG